MQILHESHQGIVKTKQLAEDQYWKSVTQFCTQIKTMSGKNGLITRTNLPTERDYQIKKINYGNLIKRNRKHIIKITTITQNGTNSINKGEHKNQRVEHHHVKTRYGRTIKLVQRLS